MKYAYFLLISILIAACADKAEISGDAADKYDLKPYPNSEFTYAEERYGDGSLIELGSFYNGKKVGAWVTYTETGGVKTIRNYIDGKLNGIALDFSNRGQIEAETYYWDGQLHGPSIKFTFGRTTEEAHYKEGQLHGMMRTYHQNGKVMKEVEFKDGLQDGIYRFYDDEGNLTLEYEYKEGEKVRGGIVDESVVK